MQKKQRSLEYDGLRGISILAIILYHLFPTRVPGGFLTVNTFFVLAGYFFTYKIESFTFDHKQRDYHRLFRYIKDTISRLFFPLLWMIGSVVIGLLFFSRESLDFLRNDLFSGLFFYNNIYQILADKSYFVRMTEASPFTHLWYNSLYLQSFLVMIVVVIIMKMFQLRGAVKAMVVGIIAFISHLSLLWLYVPGEDPSRVYYGVETRISSYALGVMLTYAIPVLLNLFYRAKSKKIGYIVTSIISLSLFVIMPLYINDQSSETYYVWLPFYSVISYGLIFSITVGVPFIRKLFKFNPLVAIGQRSYSYYLWYYPIIAFWLRFQHQMESQMYWLYLGIFISIIVIGELSYQLIERQRLFIPFLKSFSWQKEWYEFRRNNYPKWLVFVSVLFVTLITYGIAVSKNNKPLTQFVLEYQVEQTLPSLEPIVNESERQVATVKNAIENWEGRLGSYVGRSMNQRDVIKQMQASYRENIEETDAINILVSENQEVFDQIMANNSELAALVLPEVQLFAAKLPVSFFGDSIMLLAGSNAENLFLNSNYLGIQNLQIWDSLQYLSEWIATGSVHDYLVVNLGTNAGLDSQGLDDFIAIAGERQIFFVNTNSGVQHKQQVNELIKEFAAKYENVYEIDWYSYSQGHPEYYWEGENIHHSPEGSDHYIAFIAQELYRILR